MATKRIKFLNRKKLLQEHLSIRVDQQGPSRRFTPMLDLASYGFPAEAMVIVEARTLLETLRFDLGAIGKGLNFAARDISKLRSERITFNVFVLDPETARAALLAGAQFVVSPSSDAATARLCRRYQVPYLPGAATATEIIRALEDGADIVKVFPGEVLGPAFIKAIRGPLPQAPLMPTGGVSAENAEQWIRAGCVALGVGGELTKGAADDAAISERARQLLAAIRKAREA